MSTPDLDYYKRWAPFTAMQSNGKFVRQFIVRDRASSIWSGHNTMTEAQAEADRLNELAALAIMGEGVDLSDEELQAARKLQD